MDDSLNNIDTLVIIGNGFDRWQDLDTTYSSFHCYYKENRDRLMNELGISAITVKDEKGKRNVSPVEVIYGREFGTGELDDVFWKTFEESLSKIDAQRLNLMFGKEKEGLNRLDACVVDSTRLLIAAFCGWIQNCIDTSVNDTFRAFVEKHGLEDFCFPENCYFINFNYTDTLETRFGIDEDRIFYIHGKYDDEEPLIFGHSEHPHSPEMFLETLSGRFEGLLSVEKALYETDKHVQDNIQSLCFDLMLTGALASDIKHVYVLGHSLAMADIEYFDYLTDVTTCDRGDAYREFFRNRIYFDPGVLGDKIGHPRKIEKELGSIDELQNRLQYTIKRYGYTVNQEGYQDYGYAGDETITEEELGAINKKYAYEQMLRNEDIIKQYAELMKEVLGVRRNPVADFLRRGFYKLSRKGKFDKTEIPRRTADATWHISCYNDDDRKWAEEVMTALGCKNFILYDSIDECLRKIRAS